MRMTTSDRPSTTSSIDAVTRPDSLRGESGVAAVEFALVLPILMTLLMAIIDWGYYFYLSSTVVNAAREGARVGAVQSEAGAAASQAQATAQAYLTNVGIPIGAGANQAQVPTPDQPSDGSPNLTVTVTVDEFASLTGFLAPPLIPTGISYSSTMRWEMISP